jgi:hypothetical protein
MATRGAHHRPTPPERVRDAAAVLRDEARGWAAQQSWAARLPVFAYLAYGFVHHLRDPLYATFLFGGVTVGIHELGHVAMRWAPRFLEVAGGTLFQVAAPVAAGVVFARQRDYFGIAVAVAWLSFSLFGVATYMADARRYELDYVNVGGGELDAQDWDYMLSRLGLLEWDTRLAALVRGLAAVVGAAALGAGAWLLFVMAFRRARD